MTKKPYSFLKKHFSKINLGFRILCAIFLPLVIVFLLVEPYERIILMNELWKFNLLRFFECIPKLGLPEIFTIFGICVLALFQREFRTLLEKMSKLTIGGVSFEVHELKKKSDKSTINEKIIYGKLFAEQSKWYEAADMFLSLRNSESDHEKIQGLVESAYLLVQMYDRKAQFNEHLFKLVKCHPGFGMYLKKAREFCDSALQIAKKADDSSKRINDVYYKRAIVKSRLALHHRDDNCKKIKLEKEALFDLRKAAKGNPDFKLQAAFDNELIYLLGKHNFSIWSFQKVGDVLNTKKGELVDDFLKSECSDEK